MQRDLPPFRADHIGSLLRPLPVKQARTKHVAGQLSAAALTAIEDAEIKKIIAKQETIGLRSVTDGDHDNLRGENTI
jgi:5-methyltetrahydropteroyltriglutamate--homocysteine methyltransferase